MFNKIRVLFLCSLCGVLFMTAVTPLWAAEGKLWGKPFNLHGFFRQEAAWGWSDDVSWQNMSDYMTVQFEGDYAISDKVNLYFITRAQADWAYDIRGDTFGSHKPNLPQFMPDFMQWAGAKFGLIDLNYDFHDGRHKNQFNWRENDRGLELLREFYLDISPTENLSFRIGKQQVVWGETDGLRLMDLINPSDWSKDFILRDSDAGYEETRIPLWLLKGEYYFGEVGEQLNDVALEMIWNWNIKTTQVYLGQTKTGQNAFGFGAGEGGVWGLPYPNFPPFGKFNLRDEKEASKINNSEIAAKLKFTVAKSWMFTLNYFYGWQRDFVLKVRRPGYFFPLSNFPASQIPPFSILYNFITDVYGLPRGSLDNLGLAVDFDLYYPRMQIAGFTLNKDLHWLTWRASSPVLRVEALYEFKKTFNSNGKGWSSNPLNAPLQAAGFPVILAGDWSGLPGANYREGVKRRDQIRYVLGFDWQIWCKTLNPQKTFFTSFQFAHFYTLNLGDYKFLNAPYYYNKSFGVSPWNIPQSQYFISFLVMTEYDHARILPLILFVQDIEAEAWWIKAKCEFAYGDHWRPEIGMYWINGNDNTGKSFGLFDNRDEMYIKIKYQF